ncbi:MAG: hypothetical protein ACRCWY_09000 [Cellulosilyticaceae bacterium]
MDLVLGDETTKLFLNTQGTMDDIDQEMLEFLTYIEQSTDEVANASNSELVKEINEKVKYLKEDKSMEVEYMTLLERDREKFQEGREQGREQEKREIAKGLKEAGVNPEIIKATTGLTLEEIEQL